jgi:hypothetical protein
MDKERINKIKKFMKLDPEEQLRWSLTQAYFLREFLPKRERKILNKLRNAKRSDT